MIRILVRHLAMAASGTLLVLSTSAFAAVFTYADPTCSSFSSTTSALGDLAVSCVRLPAGAPPQCSVVASPSAVPPGGQVTLTATCGPAATSYAWTNVASSAATATASPTATTTYTVRGSNAQGAGNLASATVTVASTATAPQCTLSANPATLTAPGWVVLTAACSPAATSYSWSNLTGNTSSVYVTATTSYSVRGSNAVGAGNLATTTVTLTPGTSPPPPTSGTIPAACGSLAVTPGVIDWNIGNGLPIYGRTMSRGQAYIYSFTTGGPVPGKLASIGIAEYGGSTPARTIVVSDKPCDFLLTTPKNPYDVGKQATVYFSVGAPNIYGYPTLQANTRYFLNIKNENPWVALGTDTCGVGENCAFVLYLNK